MDNKPPLPPFMQETATLKVRSAEDTSRRRYVQGLAGGALAIGRAPRKLFLFI